MKIWRLFVALALVMAVAGLAGPVAVTPAQAAARAAVGKPLQSAIAAASTGRYDDANAFVRQAEAVGGLTDEEQTVVNRIKAFIAAKSGSGGQGAGGVNGGGAWQPISPPTSVGAPHSCVQNYPPISVRLGEEGLTTVAFTITRDGTVVNAVVARSSGSERLDNAALICVANWQYRPALRDGLAVAVGWKAEIKWALRQDVQPNPTNPTDVATTQGAVGNAPPPATLSPPPLTALKIDKVTVGMAKEAVLKMLGKPDRKELIPPDDEMWIYGATRIAISKGKVTYVGH